MLQNFLVILNPASGSGKGNGALKKLGTAMKAQGAQMEVFSTEYAGHALEFIRQHSLKDIDALLSIGGDGTFNEVLNGFLKRSDDPGIPIGIIPSGTGNSLMRDLGCKNAEEAIRDIFSDKRSSMDVFEVDRDGSMLYGFNMIGCGLPASINEYAESLRMFKGQRYNVAALKAVFSYQRVGYHFSNPETGETFVSDFIIAANTRHIGTGLEIAPHARMDDGFLDVVLLKPFRRRSLIPLFLKLLRGNHMRDKSVIGIRVKSMKVTAPSRELLNIDGEQHHFREFKLRVLPRRIQLLHEPCRSHP